MSRLPPLAEVLPALLTAYSTPKWPECMAARARIESARIRAQEAFLEAIRQARQQNPQFDLERQAFCTYILSVWFAVNHELCSLGRRRKWRHHLPADHIRLLSERFLEAFTIFIAHPEDGRNRYGQSFEHVIESRPRHSVMLSLGFRKMLEQHELWHAGQAELSATAKHQAGKPRQPGMPDKAVGRPKQRGPLTIVSKIAAQRMEHYIHHSHMKFAEFAELAKTTERTLRKFRKTGEIERDTLVKIAKEMNMSLDNLIKLA